jgi:hypothetical protein
MTQREHEKQITASKNNFATKHKLLLEELETLNQSIIIQDTQIEDVNESLEKINTNIVFSEKNLGTFLLLTHPPN